MCVGSQRHGETRVHLTGLGQTVLIVQELGRELMGKSPIVEIYDYCQANVNVYGILVAETCGDRGECIAGKRERQAHFTKIHLDSS